MCAIVASFDAERFRRLLRLNSHRGVHSHSFATFRPESGAISAPLRGFGPMAADQVVVPGGAYAIGHCQAPTNALAATKENIHPAENGGALLWHNGILKRSPTWDTAVLLAHLIGGRSLSEIDGSFACLLYRDGALFAFRNELAPLFYDPLTMDISSTPFESSTPIAPHNIWKVDLIGRRLTSMGEFRTKENPYLL